MKVAIFIDKQGTAIDRLARHVQVNNPYLDIRVFPVHPKRNDADTLFEAEALLEWADVIDVHYWKSGEVLRTSFPKQFSEKPKILFHFNPYDIEAADWLSIYNRVVVGNSEIHNNLPYAYLIPYGVDLKFFEFKEEYVSKENKTVLMVVNRIEGKKGVFEVARACKDLGYKLRLVGRVSSGEYIDSVLKTGAVEFIENASEEQLREAYYASAIHVCNSVSGFESGTLPQLEAMSTGCPVLTRNIGHTPDLFNGSNMVVRAGEVEDLDDLKTNLKDLMENYEWRLKLRQSAWSTVRTRDSRIMARKVVKHYFELFRPTVELVSIIIPTKDNPKSFIEALLGAVGQDYGKFEVIVADSGETKVKPIVDAMRREVFVPIKYLHFPHKNNYTLAEARNRAVVEAFGEVLVFCDDRIKMEPNAVSVFAEFAHPKTWLWGQKDGVSKGFVENFSAVRRDDLIEGGLFCERMQWYGGMTQEIRTRFEKRRGFDFTLIDNAKAKGIARSKGKGARRKSIMEAKYNLFKMYGED